MDTHTHTYSHARARKHTQGSALLMAVWFFCTNFALVKVATEVCSGHWNIVIPLVSWQRTGKAAVRSQCVSVGAIGWWGSPSVSTLQSHCAEIMPIRFGQSRPSLRETCPFHSSHTIIHKLQLYPSFLWKMSALMKAFILDPFLKLIAFHAATVDPEKASHAELCLHIKPHEAGYYEIRSKIGAQRSSDSIQAEGFIDARRWKIYLCSCVQQWKSCETIYLWIIKF